VARANTVQSGAPLKEVALIALLTLAVFVLLAIVSYSPSDPAWSFRGTSLEVDNLVGRTGAWFADVLLSLFGFVAALLPVILAVAGVRALRVTRWDWNRIGARVGSWLIVLMCAAVLLRLHGAAPAELPAGAGGMIGDWVVVAGLPLFNWVGLTLLALVGTGLGLQGALGFSWVRVAETTGEFIYATSARTVVAVDRMRDRWQARQQRRAQRPTRAPGHQDALPPDEPARRTRRAPEIKPAAPPLPPKPQQRPLFESHTIDGLPDFDLLDAAPADGQDGYSEEALAAIARLLEIKLLDFGVEAEVVSVLPGPVVTRFEVQPAAGVKVSRISGLVKDLARSLAVVSVRIVEVIPGKSVVGIEIPNEHRSVVRLRDLIASDVYQNARSPLTLALGKDIAGEAVVADIGKMPHLLVAGTTGSGKSVGVNAMLLSILYKATPEQVRLILVDPKMLELAVYEGIPHLLTPVVTDMNEAAQTLQWCVAEMDRRYRVMAALGVRNLAGYNRRVTAEQVVDPLWPPESPEPAPVLEALPLIVVVIDEFADMMMLVGKKVEQLIARIAQKARAAGIHLVLATQRPSVDVITGLIKANIPTRISFQVSSKIDSRTILDQGGAEQLLGHGDMLYLPPGTALPVRVHGAFVSDEEVHRVVNDWKKRGEPEYMDLALAAVDLQGEGTAGDGGAEQDDALYDEAVSFVLESRRASISAVQRKLRIGYNRAARLIEAMEAAGVVSTMNSNGSREVLVPGRD
jgi:S-DNA-T family DNA segregation ATPase FtsK/SpoIIIE